MSENGYNSPEDTRYRKNNRWKGPSIQSMCPNPMTSENYLVWKSQFEGALRMHHLLPYVKGTLPIPARKLIDGSDNPEYEKYVYEDEVILGWIKATVSAPIQPYVCACNSALEAWKMLEEEWSPTDPTHIQTLRNEMKALRKTADLPMKEYLQKFKGLRYSLQAAGYLVCHAVWI